MPQEQDKAAEYPHIDNRKRHPREVDRGKEAEDGVDELDALPRLDHIEKASQRHENGNEDGERRDAFHPPRGFAPGISEGQEHEHRG